ncbi:hypothetical protein Tco_1432143, partial [Tanacetum coccineum]
MSFSKRQGSDAVCYTKPLDSLKNWNDHFFWVGSFACPASFPWHTSKTVSKDCFPKSSQYNAEHYATLVAHPAPFHKVEMDLFSFIRTDDPTKVRIVERQCGEDEPKLLDATVGRTVPLLPIAPARAESELEASGTDIQFVSETAEVATEDIASLQPRQKRKQKTVVVDAGEPSHPAKKLRDDHGTPGGPTVRGKSQSVIQRLLAGAVLNAEVRGEVVPTLPFVTSSMSATPEREEGDHIDSLTRANLRTLELLKVMITATTVTATASAAPVVKESGKAFLVCHCFVFCWWNGSCPSRVYREMVDEFSPPKFFASVRRMEHDQLFTEFNVGSARQVTLGAEARMRAEYNIREKRKLKTIVDEKDTLLKAKDTKIESLRAQLLVKEAEATKAIRLRAEASNFEATEKSLRDEVKALNKRNLVLEKECDALNVKVTDLAASVKVREQEVADLDAQVTAVKSQSDNLVGRVHELETSSAGLQEKVAAYEDFIDQLERFQDENMEEVNEKFDKLCADFVEMAFHLEEKFYP